MVEGRVLLLLDLNDGTVLEVPLDNIGLLRGALGVLSLVESRPELVEVLELDEVPDVGERGWFQARVSYWQSCDCISTQRHTVDDGRLGDRGAGGDGSGHIDGN